MSDPSLYDSCQAIVHTLLMKHSWTLLTVEELAEKVYHRAHVDGVGADEELRAIAVNEYCKIWYTAAIGAGGERSNQAYSELARYLYNVALHKYREPMLAQQLTQDALVRIWEGRTKCKDPGWFLSFCLQRLKHAYTAYLREIQKTQRAQPLPGSDREDGQEELQLVDTTKPALDQYTMCEELWRRFLEQLAELHRHLTRARRQLEAVFYRDLVGLSVEEIAEQLKTSAEMVYVLCSRGRTRLREDKLLETIYQDLQQSCL